MAMEELEDIQVQIELTDMRWQSQKLERPGNLSWSGIQAKNREMEVHGQVGQDATRDQRPETGPRQSS